MRKLLGVLIAASALILTADPASGAESLTVTAGNHGETVQVQGSTVANLSVKCYQDGQLVYIASRYRTDRLTSTLASRTWVDGGAECVARLFTSNPDGTKTSTLAEQAFTVA